MAIETFPTVRTVYRNLTVAQVYGAGAGYVLVPGAKGMRYTVTDGWVRATGNFGNAHVTIGDGTTTVVTLIHEGLTNLDILRFGVATNSVATELLTTLLVNTPIRIYSDALETTGTRLEVCLDYVVSHTGGTATG